SGTGGDNLGTFNISTAASIVAAGAGAKVIKHGYHSVSSQCGSADVLQALGVKTELFPDEFYRVFNQTGLAFIFAPRYKPIPRNFAGIRQNLGARTIFNILDPLTKPALTKRQLIGVYDKKISTLVAHVLKEFGIFSGMVVSGENGLDEVNISGGTFVVEINYEEIKEYEIVPEDFGLKRWPIESLRGGDAAINKKIILDVLNGKTGGPRDVTIINAAAALKVSGKAKNLLEGIEQACHAIDSGAALKKLNEMVEISKSLNSSVY
ncbi:MAG TPA: anthranilate phosphoribosyltransferase, partial [Bacteroidetes bacterium]|nr:anthranilate phosphoribosyltransferase [Bacteroidota bacterium]